jgi:hypothetical protein
MERSYTVQICGQINFFPCMKRVEREEQVISLTGGVCLEKNNFTRNYFF